jgi:hypothetical protein
MKEIRLTRDMVAMVDDSDYDDLAQYAWYALAGKSHYYAARRNAGGQYPRIVLMHRYLMQAQEGFEVDHIDGNSLNNQRSNLRVGTKQENSANRRRYTENGSVKRERGVRQRNGRWIAEVKNLGRTIYLGTYATKGEAMEAYNTKATELYGPFARLNHV